MIAATDLEKAPANSTWPAFIHFLRQELAARPGRFTYALRIACLTTLTVFIAEVFRVPEIAYSAYIVFFISKEETSSTLLTAVLVLLAITVSVFAALAIYTFSASEPSLRLPLMAIVTIGGMFFSRISPLGPVGFAIGFLTTISLTIIDVIPGGAPIPSSEILTEFILWLWVVVALPISLVIACNILLQYLSAGDSKHEEKKQHQLLLPDAFTNPDYIRYALKATLAIFLAYIIYNMVDWPEIRTCMITCYFVALGSYGETTHKMILRLGGSMIGGAVGLAAVIFLMPYLTDIGQLCIIIGIWSLISAWVAASSEWLSYAGLQMGLAFFMSVLIGFGPTIDISQARDRVVGILLGNILIFVIFSTIWPVNVLTQARKSLALALAELAKGFLSDDEKAFVNYENFLDQAQHYIAFDPFEVIKLHSTPRINQTSIDAARALGDSPLIHSVPPSYRQVIGTWLKQAADHLNNDGIALTPAPQAPADSNEPCHEIYKRVLHMAALIEKMDKTK